MTIAERMAPPDVYNRDHPNLALPKRAGRDDLHYTHEKQREQYLAGLANEQKLFIKTLETASAKNPTIDAKIYEKIAELSDKLAPDLARKLDEARQIALDRNKPINYNLPQKIQEIHSEYGAMLQEGVLAAFPDRAQECAEAFKTVNQEMESPELLSGLGKYATIASLIGGATLGYAGYRLTSGSGMIVNVLATLAIGAAGAYFAHKYIDPKEPPLQLPNFHTKKAPQPAQGQGIEPPKLGAAPTHQPDFANIMDKNNKPSEPKLEADARSLGIKNDNLAAKTTIGLNPT